MARASYDQSHGVSCSLITFTFAHWPETRDPEVEFSSQFARDGLDAVNDCYGASQGHLPITSVLEESLTTHGESGLFIYPCIIRSLAL